MQHRNLLYFRCEINFISKNHTKILLHENFAKDQDTLIEQSILQIVCNF